MVNTWQQIGRGGMSGTPAIQTTPPQFKAPTPGIEDVFIKTGTPKDATDFLITKTKLSV